MTDAIADFWRLFTQQADALARAKSADDPVYDLLLESLQQIDSGLFIEFHAEPGASELIVTAEGDAARFPIARAVVAAAPTVKGWTVRALKPKLGFPKTVRWETLTLPIAGMV